MKPGQDKNRLLIENLPDAFAYHRIITDDRGKPVDYIFLDANPAFYAMTGLLRDQVVGRRITEIQPEIVKAEFDWIGTFGKVALTGKNVRMEQYSEMVGRWYDITAYSDAPGYFAVVFRDISEHKKTLETLGESEQRFLDIIYASDDAILLIGEDGFADCNTATAHKLGYPTREAFLRTAPVKSAPPIQPDGWDSLSKAAAMNRIAYAKGFHRFEWMHRRSDGTEFPAEVSLTPVIYQGKRMLYCVWRDLTAHKGAEAAFNFQLQAQQVISEISSTFVNEPGVKVDEGINRALRLTGELFNVDRSYVFIFSPDGETISNTHEWCNEGIAPQRHNLQHIPAPTLNWLVEKCRNLETINIPSVAKMPPEAAVEKAHLQAQSIQSSLIVPIVSPAKQLGLMGFDFVRQEKVWAQEHVSLLKTVAELIFSALVKYQAEKELREREGLQQLLMQLAKDFINTPLEKADGALNEMLSIIGEYTGVDRAYIFRHDYSRQVTTNTHEWCANGITPEINNLQATPFESFAEIMTTHQKGEIVHIPSVTAMPENHAMRAVFEQQQIRSLVLLPLLHQGMNTGFVGFDAVRKERQFTAAETSLLTVLAEIISNALSRQQLEEAMGMTNRRLREVMDLVPGYIFAKDLEGRFLIANRAVADVFGVRPEEIEGKTDRDYGATEEQIDQYHRADLAVIRSGEQLFIPEEQILRKDGSLGWFQTVKIPYEHPGWDKPAILGVATDITKRKEAEEALQRREQEFRALAENAPDVVARFDRNLRHLYVNPAIEKAIGKSREHVIGKTHSEIGWTLEASKVRAAVLQEVFQTAREKIHYFEYPSPEGRRHYHSRIVPEFAPDGTVETVLTITRDITAIKEMEAALYQEKVKTRSMHLRSLPDELPAVPGLVALAAFYRPADELQGDYYNVICRHNQLLLYLVDIKEGRDDGVMQSLYVRKSIEDYLLAHADGAPVAPGLLLRYLTDRYRQEKQGGTIPLCVFIAGFDLPPAAGENGNSSPAAANSRPGILRYAASGFCTSPLSIKGAADPGGLILEKLSLPPDDGTDLIEHALTIVPGSTFIFSTDGLFNQGPDQGSCALRLRDVLCGHAHLPPELINRAVETDFDQCFSDFTLQNDLAFIVAQVPQWEQRLSFKVESDVTYIEGATEEVSTFLAQRLGQIPDLLHFHELLVNAIEHGNKRDGGKKVSVDLTLTERYYKVIITDQGEGFNWRERLNKEMDWESESERGRGIIMTRIMTDYLGYNKRGNRVTMINLLSKPV